MQTSGSFSKPLEARAESSSPWIPTAEVSKAKLARPVEPQEPRLWEMQQVPSKDLLLTSRCQIPQDTFRGLVASTPRRVRADLAARGGTPQYQAGGFNVADHDVCVFVRLCVCVYLWGG